VLGLRRGRPRAEAGRLRSVDAAAAANGKDETTAAHAHWQINMTSSHEPVRWLRTRSEVLTRRSRLGWALVMWLGAIVCLGVAAIHPREESKPREASDHAETRPDQQPTEASPPDLGRTAVPEVPAAPASESTQESAGNVAPSAVVADSAGGQAPAAPTVSNAGADAVTSSTQAWQAREGWWVILASFAERYAIPEPTHRALLDTASRCRVSAGRERSSDFEGFTPGYTVYVLGPFSEKTAAEQLLPQVKACVPGAYLKWAKPRGPLSAAKQ
jgi:hypothetical protein